MSLTTARANDIDSYIKAQMKERHIPGLAIAIVQNGDLSEFRGYGLSSVEHEVPVTVRSIFEIGSVTKQVTAVGIMLLVEDGRVDLDAPIRTYMKESPIRWDAVTIRHLLTHTSGIRNYTGLPGFELSRRMNRAAFIHELAKYPLDFTPGEKWSYSNSGYNLLGHIIEQASDQTYWDFLANAVFKPANMADTGDRDLQYVIKHRATGYEWIDDSLLGRDYDLTDLFSAGAMVSSLADLVRWNAALSEIDLLQASSMRELWKPVTLNNGETYPYGFGWYIENIRGYRRLRHNGQTAGFSANYTHYPDQNLSIIVLCNLGTIGLAGDIANGAAKYYIPGLSLKNAVTIDDVAPELTKSLKKLLDDRWNNILQLEKFTGNARKKLITDNAVGVNKRLATYGKPTAFDLIGHEQIESITTRYYRVVIGNNFLVFRVVATDSGLVDDMTLMEEE